MTTFTRRDRLPAGMQAELGTWVAATTPTLAERVERLAAETPLDAAGVAYLLTDVVEGPFGSRTPTHVAEAAIEWLNDEGLFATEGDIRRALGLHPDFTPTPDVEALASAYRKCLRFTVETVNAARSLINLATAALGTRAVEAALAGMNPADLPEAAVTALRAALADHLRELARGPRIAPTTLRMDWGKFTVEGDRDDRELDHRIADLLDDPYTETASWDRAVLRLYADAIYACPDVSYLRLAQITVAAFSLDPDGSLLSLEGTGTPEAVLGVHAVVAEATASGVAWLGQQQMGWLTAEADLARTHLGLATPAA